MRREKGKREIETRKGVKWEREKTRKTVKWEDTNNVVYQKEKKPSK